MPILSYDAAPQSAVSASLMLVASTALALAASPVSGMVASVGLSGSTASLQAGAASYLSASATLSGATAKLYASPASGMTATASINGATAALSAFPVVSVNAGCVLSGATAQLRATPAMGVSATADLTGGSDGHGMSVCDVVDEVLGMWGIFSRCSAPSFALDRAINDINTALQTVWNHADERNYWSSSTLTLTLADGASSQDLPDDIQNVVGPCRLSTTRRPLAPIGTIGELERFSDLYLDGDTASEPIAYHIERMNQAGGDPARTVFHVTPAVSGTATAFLLEVVKEAPRFNLGDLTACPLIPIPHRYVESLLLPIARYQASSFYLFRKGDQKETIDREYQQARLALGLADPLPGKAGDNKEGTPAAK